MTGVFVTATGTEIGKTFVTTGLIHALRRRGRAVCALKPVVSGFDPAASETSDPGRLLAALGRPVTLAEAAAISPWRFWAALSPDMAARRENTAIDFGALVEFCRAELAGEGTLLIEGVGGVMVPLDARRTVLDWIEALRLAVILVSGSYLGAISHALSAADVLARRGLPIAALVVNETPGSAVPLAETTETIARFVPATVLALPRLSAANAPHPAWDQIAARL